MRTLLPGQLLNKVSVFELKVGDKILDPTTQKVGSISNIKEFAYEEIEAVVLLGDKEVRAKHYPMLIYLGQ